MTGKENWTLKIGKYRLSLVIDCGGNIHMDGEVYEIPERSCAAYADISRRVAAIEEQHELDEQQMNTARRLVSQFGFRREAEE